MSGTDPPRVSGTGPPRVSGTDPPRTTGPGTRPPAVAGAFYPADPPALAATVDALIAAVQVPADPAPGRAYVVPHAGYRFSGRTAAQVYGRLRGQLGRFDRAVVIGPAHRVPLRGAAVPLTRRWRTPLGELSVDVATALDLAGKGLATASDEPHAPEHSIEVQLPFLQRLLFDGPILPVCIGQSTADEVADLLDAAVDARTLLLCSTDLSHYLPDEQARQRDARTAAAIAELAPERIGPYDACGRYALRGLLRWARGQGLSAEILELSTSADAGAGRDRVVGYPAVALLANGHSRQD